MVDEQGTYTVGGQTLLGRESPFFKSLQIAQIKASAITSQPCLFIVYKCYGLNESIEILPFVVGALKYMCLFPSLFVYQYQPVHCAYSNGMCILLCYATCFNYVVRFPLPGRVLQLQQLVVHCPYP